MDLITAAVLAWMIVRGSVEDTAYAVRGKQSPRQAYRQRHGRGPGGMSKVGRAYADRWADRVNNPRPKGPVRSYFGALLDDSLTAATEHRRRRQADKARRQEARAAGAQPTSWRRRAKGWFRDAFPSWHTPEPEQAAGPQDARHTGPATDRAGSPGPSSSSAWSTPQDPTGETNPQDVPTEPAGVITATAERLYEKETDTTTEQTDPNPVHLITRLGGEFSPDLDAYAAGELSSPRCVLCSPGSCTCHAARLDDADDMTDEQWAELDDYIRRVNARLGSAVDEHASAHGIAQWNHAPRAQIGAETMTATVNAAEGSLAAYRAYTEDMIRAMQDAVTSLEATAAAMSNQQYGGQLTGIYAQAGELAAALGEQMRSALPLLDQSSTVAESYAAAPHTGSRESLIEG